MAIPAVRLKYLESDNFAPGGGIGTVNNTSVTAKVENIAFVKDVALRFAGFDGWREQPLTFQDGFGDYDLFSYSGSDFSTTRFAIRYTVQGVTFWDNNGGFDYRVDESRPNTVGGNVVLGKAVARRGTQAGGGFVFATSWVEGEILVKNLSFNKLVGIRLTTNGWTSFIDTAALFNHKQAVAVGLSQVEVWTFKTPELNLDPSSDHFEFAVFYENRDSGERLWDNNFGQDYTLSKQDQASDG